ncbi:hypothetical protein KDA11_04925 [Candidatus Saccharibacteria bacterium]|nr:hypothetical protein [Candidatus Saccharibacteria bacterium]
MLVGGAAGYAMGDNGASELRHRATVIETCAKSLIDENNGFPRQYSCAKIYSELGEQNITNPYDMLNKSEELNLQADNQDYAKASLLLGSVVGGLSCAIVSVYCDGLKYEQQSDLS